MKPGKLQTGWVLLLSALYTAYTCGFGMLKGRFGTITRPWVDKMLQEWTNRILKVVRIQCTVINPNGVAPQPNEPTILMCNHSSLFDIPLSFRAFPNHSVRMLSKQELAKIPIMGGGMKAAEFPLIDRKNTLKAIRNLEYVSELLKSGIVMWMAPEGTRSKDGKLAPFKKGAFIVAIQTKAKIIPMAIRGASTILPARTFQINLDQKAEIHIGKPIDAGQYTLENKQELIDRVHQSMKQLLGEG